MFGKIHTFKNSMTPEKSSAKKLSSGNAENMLEAKERLSSAKIFSLATYMACQEPAWIYSVIYASPFCSIVRGVMLSEYKCIFIPVYFLISLDSSLSNVICLNHIHQQNIRASYFAKVRAWEKVVVRRLVFLFLLGGILVKQYCLLWPWLWCHGTSLG